MLGKSLDLRPDKLGIVPPSTANIISVPVAAPTESFRWQLDLFWFGHRRTYGANATAKAHAILCNRNDFWDKKITQIEWNISVPHTVCHSLFDIQAPLPGVSLMYNKIVLALPLNIQIGLAQILNKFDDDQLLEVNDCDMVHFRPCPFTDIRPNELIVSTVYEEWHLHSLAENSYVIAPYFENRGCYYNGGFVPIIGRVSTFKRIIREWIAVHIDILNRPHDEKIHWWAGMFALQAACEKAKVKMVAEDCCYVPGVNQLAYQHYTGHYCVDSVFDKRTYPNIDTSRFLDNPFYGLVKEWIGI